MEGVAFYFTVVQRKVPTADDFPELGTQEKAILEFRAYYATIARPFAWEFTRVDLQELLLTLAQHDPRQAVA